MALIAAARVPECIPDQEFGLWRIERIRDEAALRHAWVGPWKSMTLLHRVTAATLHRERGEIVMEDSLRELRRHLPIWMAASGRVLITGLGLGCVVRGLLAIAEVRHVDVIEVDRGIIRALGKEFIGNERVRIHEGDARDAIPGRWDFAWHDVWCEAPASLAKMHGELIRAYADRTGRQGAWMFPRVSHRVVAAAGIHLLGAPNYRRAA